VANTSLVRSPASPLARREPHTSVAPLVVTWIASIASVGLGIGARLFGAATYDPVIALTTVSAVGLAWYTYFTRKGIVDAAMRAEAQLIERRTSIATAVLAELASLTARLKNLHDEGPSAAKPEFVNAPGMEHACENPELFATVTVQTLLEARRRVEDVRLYLNEIDTQQGRASAANNYGHSMLTHMTHSQLADAVKFRAGWAFNKAIELAERMQEEGGRMPQPGEPSLASDEDIPLREDPFQRS
jgi:hypothetical protein